MAMKVIKTVFALILFLSPGLMASVAGAAKAASYRSVFKPYYGPGGRTLIAIRSFTYGDEKKYLALDPLTFETFLAGPASVEASGEVPPDLLNKTPFMKALERYTVPAGGLQNSGITVGECAANGFFLTIDMCPSRKEFERELFTATAGLNTDAPAPVAIAVSGLWIERHKKEFDWIVNEEKEGRLAVTWVNHTYSHPYNPRKPDIENFLLTPGVDFEGEVLRQETTLIEHGGVPSPFFRFPGLVSNDGLLVRLKALSLIPVGTDAWIAKREVPVECSIVLVHGNGNEPEGIQMLLKFYEEKRDAFSKGALRLLPLKDAFAK